MAIQITKDKLFNLALEINTLEHKKDESKKTLLKNYKRDYKRLMNYFKEIPGPAMFDEYLLFTTNRENYSLEECLLIERNLIKELKPKIVEACKANLN